MSAVPKVYIDTNVFIAAYEHVGAGSDHARWIFDALEDGRIRGATSELTLAELLVRPLQENATDLVQAYKAMIQPAESFEMITVHRDILIEAARVRAERSAIRLPDAIHVASARALGCNSIVTDDNGFRTARGPRVVRLGAFTVDDLLSEP